MRHMNRYMYLAVVAGTLFWVLNGDSQVTTGTISGTVTDSTGAVLPGASVVLLNEETGVSRTTQTDSAGRYSAPSLSLGHYRVTATSSGFQTEVRSGIELTLGRQAVVDLQLAVGAVSQSVEVTGEAPLVQTTDATVGYLVEDKTIRDLPLNGRDLTQLILLNPSVGQAMNATTNQSYTGFGKYISISGGRSEDNSYLLDGSFIGDFSRHVPAGPSGALLGAETVREFQVLTNSYSAQYGRVAGGVFNAVSKSGTNEWHGDLYEYLRNSALDANAWEDNALAAGEKPPFRRNQFGATMGGPIRRDKAFFFVAYEGMRQSQTTTATDDVPDANARRGVIPALGFTEANPTPVSPKIQPWLLAIPLPSPQGAATPSAGTQQFVFPAVDIRSDDFGQGRFDYNLSANDSFFARVTSSNGQGTHSLSLPMFQQIGILATTLATVAETHVFSPRMLNTLTISFNRVDPIDKGTYPQVGPDLISAPGQPPAGVGYGWEGSAKPLDRFLTNRFGYKDDVNLTLGSHTLQFGGMLERMQLNENQPNRPYGAWTFSDITTFLSATPRQFRGTPPVVGTNVYNPVRGMRQWFAGLYLEDNWRVNSRFNVTLGVRWEPYTSPTEVNNLLANLRHFTDASVTTGEPFWQNTSAKDIGPRVGFVWSPFASGNTSFRGGFGMFYVPNDPLIYYVQVTRIPPYFPELTLTSINPALFPDAIATILSAAVPNGSPNTVQYTHLRSPRTYQYNLNLQQQLGKNTVVSVSYVGTRGLDTLTYSDINRPFAAFNGIDLEVPSTATRMNRNFEGILQYSAGGSSWYNGMAMTVRRKLANGLQAQVAYTFARALSTGDSNASVDHTGSGAAGLKYSPDISVSKALSGYNITNRLVGNYSYDLPLGKGRTNVLGHLTSGWQLSGIVTLQSGQPFSIANASGATASALSGLGYSRGPNVDTSFTGSLIQGGPDQYFNPQAFYLPAGNFELGNVGRNTLIGPGLATWDSSLIKNTSITERWKLQFRAEFFNLLNRPNFGLPAASIFTSGGKRVETAGRISNTVGSSRQIQFGLKLAF